MLAGRCLLPCPVWLSSVGAMTGGAPFGREKTGGPPLLAKWFEFTGIPGESTGGDRDLVGEVGGGMVGVGEEGNG